VLAGLTGLIVAVVPAGGASAGARARAGSHPTASAIGDNCLIGTWHADGGRATMLYRGTNVTMHLRGGDIDHISRSGIDHDNWKKSKPAVGRLHGHKLTERIRGVNRLRLSAARHHGTPTLTVTESGWSKSRSNRFVYRGKHSRGFLSSTGASQARYRCTAQRLTLRRHGKVIERETRLSRKP
jgi:hypothetical protein